MIKTFSLATLLYPPEASGVYKKLERIGRTCYQSETHKNDTPEAFLSRVIARKHFGILEHELLTINIICDRGITHELVRHRIASFAQESTRYCNYSKEKFQGNITYIDLAPGLEIDPTTSKLDQDRKGQILQEWQSACLDAESHYMSLLELGASPQIARSVLNNSTKSEINVTMNMNSWRHFIDLRYLGTTGCPHPQMLELSKQIKELLVQNYPVLFLDLVNQDSQECN